MNQDKFPKISIVTPVFNCARFLEETIQSVLGQHYPNLEYIIIDGESTDGSVDIIRKYESHLAYWISEADKGMYDALQKGFDHSTGEIMGWLNADDIFFPNSLFAIAKSFYNNPKVNWITSHHAVIDKDGVIDFIKLSTNYSKLYFYLPSKPWRGNEIGQESTFWRRSLWEKAGSKMSVSLKLAGDFELWIRFFQYDYLYVTNSMFGIFRQREGQLSSNIERYWEEADRILEAHPLSLSEKKLIDTYIHRKKISTYIDKLKIFNSRKICRLNVIEKKIFDVPPQIYL